MTKKSQVILLEQFWKSEEYLNMKKNIEKCYFKLDGDYHKFCEKTNTLKKISLQSIKEHFKNKKITITIENPVMNDRGKWEISKEEISKDFYSIWSEDPNLKEYNDIKFSCEDEVDENIFNLYRGLPKFSKEIFQKSETVSLEPIYEHIKSLVNYNDEHFEYMLNWLAHIVQYTETPCGTCIVIISDEGCGKDLFSNFVGSCLNENYYINTQSIDKITGKYNGVLGGKLFITVNELDGLQSREHIEALKYLITAEDLLIENKYQNPVKCKSYARYIFFSNQLTAFPVTASSRRPIIFNASNKHLPQICGQKESEKYFSKLYSIYKSEVYQCAFLRMLCKRDISKWNFKDVTKSELQQELMDCSVTPVAKFLAQIIVQKNLDKETVKLSSVESLKMCNDYMRDNHYKYDLNATKFSVEMTMTYKVKKVKNSTNYFIFDIKELKELLENKHGFKFEVEKEDDDEIEDVVDDNYIKMQEELNELRRFRAQYQKEWEYFKSCQVIENKKEVPVETSDDEEEEELVINKECNVTDDDLQELSNVLDKL